VLKILLTNQSLAVRTGTEPLMRDLARAMQGRGHFVFGFSSDPCQRERLLERDLIAVATKLEHLPFRPDVIHAQHHLDALTALTALPDVPCLYHEHGGPWQSTPPVHPRIHRYLAASQPLADGMRAAMGANATEVTPWLHPVDASRLQKVRKLPLTPARALFVNVHFPEFGKTVPILREAAARCGLTLDFAGREFGCGSEEAEEILPEYDVVFASGQVAAEALACGCAVVTYGAAGYGEMVSSENYEKLRQENFTPQATALPIPFDQLEGVLGAYQVSAGPQLAERIRMDAEFGQAVERLLEMYQDVILRHQQSPSNPESESQALSRYLRNLAPGIMRANNHPNGLMRPKVSWVPTALPSGNNPQK
jgi:hypothetical protein